MSGIYRVYQSYLEGQIDDGEIPQHVGIILDGNRRWASKHLRSRRFGHWAGAENAEHILEWCHELGIKVVTIYILSTENLERAPDEVKELLEIIEERLKGLLNDGRVHRHRIKVKSLGTLSLLPESTRRLLEDLEVATKDYSDHFLNIAIAYGGRTEILEGVRKIAEKVYDGRLKPSEIDLKTVEAHLYTAHLPNPEPDLIIRTSGEERLSGFLLWQGAYSELVFMDVYWPDFRKIDLMRAIRTYNKRSRRFGR